jgi:SAM-dependent methyltransferase
MAPGGRARRVASRLRGRTQAALVELPGTPHPPVIGLVEEFTGRRIAGWVAARPEKFPVRVSLHVGAVEVASTWANDPSNINAPSEVRGFGFALADLWRYAKRSQRLTVQVDGRTLPIAGCGMYRHPAEDGENSPSQLHEKFEQGYVFAQTGHLQLSKQLDTRWQEAVLDLYQRVCGVVESTYGYTPFLIYGSLLGLVREGGFIGHDVDFDAAYLSRHRDGRSAAVELRNVGLALVDAGFDVECKRTALHIHDGEIRIDLFDLYFDENGELTFPFGVAGTTTLTQAHWDGLTETDLAGRRVYIPVSAERLVEHIYGSSWRTPIAGFDWKRARTRWEPEAWTTPNEAEEVYWANFYAHNELSAGSTFWEFINVWPQIPATIVDIGCGDGRDSFAFARASTTVLAMDRSEIAIRHASKKAADLGLSNTLGFTVGDVSEDNTVTTLVTRARLRSNGGPVLFYMRFFLHSITADVQEKLLRALSDAAQPGDMLAAEFRTDKDKPNRKVYGKHYRRYQDAESFSTELRQRYGFTPGYEHEASGLAPYRDEDPVLYRVVAYRDPEPAPPSGETVSASQSPAAAPSNDRGSPTEP